MVPTTHALLPSFPSLRLVKGWVTLYPESGPMKRERYTCTNTSTRRIVRLRVCACSNSSSTRSRMLYLRGEKKPKVETFASWRRCLAATFLLLVPFVPSIQWPQGRILVLMNSGWLIRETSCLRDQRKYQLAWVRIFLRFCSLWRVMILLSFVYNGGFGWRCIFGENFGDREIG